MTITVTHTITKTINLKDNDLVYILPSDSFKAWLKKAIDDINKGIKTPTLKVKYRLKDMLNSFGLVPVYVIDDIFYVCLDNNHPIFDTINITGYIISDDNPHLLTGAGYDISATASTATVDTTYQYGSHPPFTMMYLPPDIRDIVTMTAHKDKDTPFVADDDDINW